MQAHSTASTDAPAPDGAHTRLALPVARTRLLGRAAELADARRLLIEEDVGLLTLTSAGAFGTLKRKVEVTFAEITVTDDSDDLSACDCSFDFTAGSQVAGWGYGTGNGLGYTQISTGQTVHPNVTITVLDAPDSLLLRVMGRDNDSEGFFLDGCGPGDSPAQWTSGADACWDWSSASKSIHVAGRGFAEEMAEDFYIRADGGPLHFRVLVKFKVTYVP